MAGTGPAPKPDAQRVRRNAPTFDWVNLPERNEGPVPELPTFRTWDKRTVEWWTDLWAKPQASQWFQDGSTLWTLVCLYDEMIISEGTAAASLSSEIRQHEDRHGLNPKAMLQLRWRIADPAEAAVESPATARRKRVKVVD